MKTGGHAMISLNTLKSDAFFELSSDAKVLYLYDISNADLAGVVENAGAALRESGLTKEARQELIDNGFEIEVNGCIVIIRWLKENSRLQIKDRYKPDSHGIGKRITLKADDSFEIDGDGISFYAKFGISEGNVKAGTVKKDGVETEQVNEELSHLIEVWNETYPKNVAVMHPIGTKLTDDILKNIRGYGMQALEDVIVKRQGDERRFEPWYTFDGIFSDETKLEKYISGKYAKSYGDSRETYENGLREEEAEKKKLLDQADAESAQHMTKEELCGF